MKYQRFPLFLESKPSQMARFFFCVVTGASMCLIAFAGDSDRPVREERPFDRSTISTPRPPRHKKADPCESSLYDVEPLEGEDTDVHQMEHLIPRAGALPRDVEPIQGERIDGTLFGRYFSFPIHIPSRHIMPDFALVGAASMSEYVTRLFENAGYPIQIVEELPPGGMRRLFKVRTTIPGAELGVVKIYDPSFTERTVKKIDDHNIVVETIETLTEDDMRVVRALDELKWQVWRAGAMSYLDAPTVSVRLRLRDRGNMAPAELHDYGITLQAFDEDIPYTLAATHINNEHFVTEQKQFDIFRNALNQQSYPILSKFNRIIEAYGLRPLGFQVMQRNNHGEWTNVTQGPSPDTQSQGFEGYENVMALDIEARQNIRVQIDILRGLIYFTALDL